MSSLSDLEDTFEHVSITTPEMGNDKPQEAQDSPNRKRTQQQKITHESPTNVRTPLDLVDVSAKYLQYQRARANAKTAEEARRAAQADKTRFAVLQPFEQMLLIDSRACGSTNLSIHTQFLLDGNRPNQWQEHNFSNQPTSEKVNFLRFMISETVCDVWQEALLSNNEKDSPEKNTSFVHLIIVNRAGEQDSRKLLVTETVAAAASEAFHALLNGYSVVFIGVMMKAEYIILKPFSKTAPKTEIDSEVTEGGLQILHVRTLQELRQRRSGSKPSKRETVVRSEKVAILC